MKREKQIGKRTITVMIVMAFIITLLPMGGLAELLSDLEAFASSQDDGADITTTDAIDIPQDAETSEDTKSSLEMDDLAEEGASASVEMPGPSLEPDEEALLEESMDSDSVERFRKAHLGTRQEHLGLPQVIDGRAVTWTASPEYDPETRGLYVFTADDGEETTVCILLLPLIMPLSFGLGTQAVPLEIVTTEQLAAFICAWRLTWIWVD